MKLKIVVLFLSAVVLASCGSKRRVARESFRKSKTVAEKKVEENKVEEKQEALSFVYQQEHIKKLKATKSGLNTYTLSYIEKYAPIAVREMHVYKIPASITLAQGVLESGNGRSFLASKSNNHFGIKCHTAWQGERVYHDDDEKGECFRKYKYVETSYKDHSKFLTQRSRYAFLFDYGTTDYKKWAKGLRKAGYATDVKYPEKLIKIIETYELYKFDKIKGKHYPNVKEEPVKQQLKESYYEVQKGDTLYSISRKFNMTVDQVKKINSFKDNALSIGQRIVILK